jgi:hypothetical protein
MLALTGRTVGALQDVLLLSEAKRAVRGVPFADEGGCGLGAKRRRRAEEGERDEDASGVEGSHADLVNETATVGRAAPNKVAGAICKGERVRFPMPGLR